MAKRIVTKVGNVFCVEIDNEYKCFFQYIEKDVFQLGSSVIRAFKTRYPMDYKPVIEDIVKDEILFYKHTILRVGIEDGAWYKVGKSKELGLDGLSKVLWGTVHDYKATRVPPEEGYFKLTKVNPIENWEIWKIYGERIAIGILPSEYYEIIEEGAVTHYSSIVERLKYGYSRGTNWCYDIIKRRPIVGVNSYTKREIEGKECYFHFIGEDIYREMIVTPQGVIKLTQEEPEKDGYTFHAHKFWEINWKYRDHITEADFLTSWNKS
jgi:hypothetical protein